MLQKQAGRIATFFAGSVLVVTSGCAAPVEGSFEEEGDLGQTADALNGTTNFPRGSGCGSTSLQSKIREAMTLAHDLMFTSDMLYCMREHGLTGTNGDSPEAIVNRMRQNVLTNVYCADLTGENANADIGISSETLTLDRTFATNSTQDVLASVILHEIAHNKGYEHGHDATNSDEYQFFVSEQLEACAQSIANGQYAADFGVGATAMANGLQRGELKRGTKLAPAGGNGGTPVTMSAGNNRFVRGFYGRVDDHITTLGLFSADRNGNAQQVEPQVGGSGGLLFNQDCGDGALLVGFDGWHGSYLNEMLALCRTVTNIRARSYDFFTVGEAGPLTGNYFTRLCPYGMAVKRFYFRTGSLIDRIELECENVDFGQIQGGSTLAAFGSTAGTVWRDRCPVGSVMNGLFGRAGSRIDHLGASCQQWELKTSGTERFVGMTGRRTAAILEGRGGFGGSVWGTDQCTSGSAMVGILAKGTSTVERVVGVCADAKQWSDSRVASVTTSRLGLHGGGTTVDTTIERMCPRPLFLAGWDIAANSEVRSITPVCVRAED